MHILPDPYPQILASNGDRESILPFIKVFQSLTRCACS